MDTVPLSKLRRVRHIASRVWYLQPKLALSNEAPFVPVLDGATSHALQLIRACVRKECKDFPPPTEAPTLILVPELAIHPSEFTLLRSELRACHGNTLFVGGLGHMTEAQARAIENADLWDGPSDGRYTNCALVAVGGSDQFFLQPKIVPSATERDFHWKGKGIRLFTGTDVAFGVVVCSELLDRPLHETTLKTFLQESANKNCHLSFVIWVQHNPKPRSGEFDSSLQQLRTHSNSTAVLIVDSSPHRPERYESYGVSGAIVAHEYLPLEFRFLAGRHHCVEPVGTGLHLGRIVLLRYDADAVLVNTVFCDAIDIHSKTAKTLFENIRHYSYCAGNLAPNDENCHIQDLLRPVLARCVTEGVSEGAVERVAEKVVALGISGFLSFLDVALWPCPADGDQQHLAGEPHPGGDFLCRCWRHRVCVDRLCVDAFQQEWLADVLGALATLEQHNLNPNPTFNRRPLQNADVVVDDRRVQIAVIHPCGRDRLVGEALLADRERPPLLLPSCIILGDDARGLRPRVGSVDASRVPPPRASDASRAETATPALIYQQEFWKAHASNRIRDLITERFVIV